MIDKDQMKAWLVDGQGYPGGAESADRAVRMLERAKASFERLAPGSMFDTEPSQVLVVMEAESHD
ncbi:MAG: hypothetical protein KDC18_07665 [Alphaproteobacteria bacterium]|nr:hypothetical protein [Alphaproteobacteria bacterium]MCB9931274.1 hypothetical protein [Alphaproteobacteria bacterium]